MTSSQTPKQYHIRKKLPVGKAKFQDYAKLQEFWLKGKFPSSKKSIKRGKWPNTKN